MTRLGPNGDPDVHRQVVAEQPRRELERRRPPAHRTEPSRRRRQRTSPRDAEPGGGRRGDQHLERQVPLRASGGRFRRSAGRRRTATPRPSPDLTWTPLLTAPYPDHVSGHLGLDSSHTAVLRMFFGNAPAGGYQITSFFVNPGGPATRSFSSFSQAVDEIVEARIWAGLHFRTADVQAVSSERTSRTSPPRTTSSPWAITDSGLARSGHD